MKPGRLAWLGVVVATTSLAAASPALRHPVHPNGSGWVRLELTPELQLEANDLWLSDESGTAVPFLRDRPIRQTRSTHPVDTPILGTNAAGEATIEFSLPAVAAPHPAQPVVVLDMGEGTDWVARAKVSRRAHNGDWLTATGTSAEAVYAFNQNQPQSSVRLPADGQRYRIALAAIAGTVPPIVGASQLVDHREARQTRSVSAEISPLPGTEGEWRISAPAAVRLQAIELTVDGSFAPITCSVRHGDSDRPPLALTLSQAVIWHMPALASQQLTIIPWDYPMVNDLVIKLPSGPRLRSARLLAQEEQWLFPAETQRTYYLHRGSKRRLAAGDLAQLTPPSFDSPLPLASIGAAEPDFDVEASTTTPLAWGSVARALPWFVAVLVGLLGWGALRLLRKQTPPRH